MKENKSPFSISLILLILVNLIPVFGVFLLNWSPLEVVYLYWVETLIIGLFNIPKMLISKGAFSIKIFLIPFFCIHFGIFILVQGIFIITMDPSIEVTHNSGEIDVNLDSIDLLIYGLLKTLWWPSLLIFGSHLFSFYYNFIRNEEFNKENAVKLMFNPYRRIFVQQFLAIFGTFIVISISYGRVLVMLFVIVAKTVADGFAHYKEHRINNFNNNSEKA